MSFFGSGREADLAAISARMCSRRAALVALGSALAACSTVSVPPEGERPRPTATRAPRIGLALGGGAARGFAHVGVIEVLESAGIRPSLIAGTSAGSVVGAIYASGMHAPELQHLAETMNESAVTDWVLPWRAPALLRGVALERFVNETVRNLPIERLPVPFGAVATDLKTGAPMLFRRGNTGLAVRASSAVPAVFAPVDIGGREFVDGGLVAPVPAGFARQMGAEMVIAVDISTPPGSGPVGDTFTMLMQTFSIMGQAIKGYDLKTADVVIRPNLGNISGTDFGARSRAMEAGRLAARAALPSIQARIAALSR